MADTPSIVYVASTDATVREVLARVVEADGHAVVRSEADDLAAAVIAAGANAVVLDLGAANQETLESIRSRPEPNASGVRVIVIGTGPAGARLAWPAGADGYLVRPFDATELQEALADALAADQARRAAVRIERTQGLSA